jgi:hypothetical protein
MTGDTLLRASNLQAGEVLSSTWAVIDSGDFDRDSWPDLLLQHPNGSLQIWTMNCTNRTAEISLWEAQSGDEAWRAIAVQDFNNDGNVDILFQKDDAALAIWYMNRTNLLSVAMVEPKPDDVRWRAVAAGDFNSDGNADIVFEHADGRIVIWYLKDSRLLESAWLEPVSPGDGTGESPELPI